MLAILVSTICLSLATTEAGLAGGLSDIQLDGTDPNVQFALKAINTYFTLLGDSEPRTLVEVVHAQTQVVAGTMYHLELRLKSINQEELCKVGVWSRPWLSGDDALQMPNDPVCKVVMTAKSTAAPVITGGSVNVDSKDADVMKALMFATETINAQSNNLYYSKPGKIEEVKSQVVAGMAYHFRGVHMGTTTCTKTNTLMIKEVMACQLQDPVDEIMCNFDVWWQSWRTPEYQMTSMQCQ